VVSLLAHLLFLALILVPAMRSDFDPRHAEGGGGKGPAGGGGGGTKGGAGDVVHERLRFVGIAAPPHATSVAHVVTPPAPPVIQPPKLQPVVPPVSPPVPARPPTAAAPVTQGAASPFSGLGSGVGGSGTTGVGPGSGGGVGSGEGAGRGSGTRPGTGGGNATIYPPTPTQFFLPPLPAPKSLRGFHLTAWFDVDSLGKSKLLRFNASPDNDYNKRLRETLLSVKFRPAVRPDGIPVRDTVDVQFVF
jgi:periplasmic protein TonB